MLLSYNNNFVTFLVALFPILLKINKTGECLNPFYFNYKRQNSVQSLFTHFFQYSTKKWINYR